MTGWRFRARRFGGDWLWTDVPLTGTHTDELNGPGMFAGELPRALDVQTAGDGLPVWVERQTLLYVQRDRELWAGICTHVGDTATGREVEAVGLPGALQWMPYDGEYRAWAPNPFDVVEAMLEEAQSRRTGNLGLTLERVNKPPRHAGDERPTEPRPEKPPRRDGESRERYDDRLLEWEKRVDEWEEAYADLEPYELMWWESPYVGRELDDLSAEVPFDYRGRYEWTDEERLIPRHVLEVGGRLGDRRHDVQLIDGVNLRERPRPETDDEEYANEVIVLGAGEGRDMRRARAAVNDGRVRSTKYVAAKDVRKQTRLDAIAERELGRSRVVTTLDEVQAWDVPGYGSLATLRPGDEVWVESRHTTPRYAAWRRVSSVARSVGTSTVTVRFVAGQEAAT